MSLIDKDLDLNQILHLLDEIKNHIKEEGFKEDIVIYGGAAMMYHQNGSEGRRTQDIDASFGHHKQILQIIQKISKDKKLELSADEKWFNNQIVQSDNILPRHSDDEAIEYCQESNVTIKIASKNSLLAMKAISMVKRGRTKDIEDTQWLIKNLKISNKDQLLDIVKKYWSPKQLQNMDVAHIVDVWQNNLKFYKDKKGH